jgi:hypothetical protein
MTTIAIRGEGVAGLCCARLLGGSGFNLSVEKPGRPRLPAIMMGEATQKLLQDVFANQNLFSGLGRIRKRFVAWGAGSEPIALPHSALVVSEQALLTRIQQEPGRSEAFENRFPEWTIFASSPLPSPSIEHHFGSRMAAACQVRLKPDSSSEACWVESLKSGWLFLLPDGEGSGWLLSVGEATEFLLSGSRLIQKQILSVSSPRGMFPCHPRIAQPLAEPGWIACGTAALGFDPLCGDGTANAVREAILGSAVIRAATSQGFDVYGLVLHYRTRLLAGFKRHLELCLNFYMNGHSGPWWDDQLNELRRGLEWCAQAAGSSGRFGYRLNGFTLEPAD